jgi:L-aspartate oxidase
MTSPWDFVVVGSGLAGLTFALKAAEHGRVCVLTKASMTDANTTWAQGGIAAAVGESDSWQLHEQDTLIAGAGLCDPDAVRFLCQEAPDAIAWLQSLGAQFDVNHLDEFALGREGGHSRHRIIHHADKTGWEVERAVSAAVRAHPSIQVFEHSFVSRLIVEDGRCIGVQAEVNDLGARVFLGKATMLASGGCGKIYAKTTNPRVATADGIALASRVGARVEGMEFMQFHPTVLVSPQLEGFLITEACRGAGGTLRNHMGRRFMYDYDERLELSPRDVVARAIEREMAKLDTWCVYLDMTHLEPAKLKHEFPTIWDKLQSIGIDMSKDWIPVAPAQHYSCGGVKTDLHARTSVPGLYASGETASTGVHGANRLASNSLLEAMVFSMAAAKVCIDEPTPPKGKIASSIPRVVAESEAIRIRHTLQRMMSQKVGVFRSNRGLAKAKSVVDGLIKEYHALPEAPFSAYSAEAENLLIAARHVVEQAIARKINVGLHFNVDQAEPEA